MLSKTFHRWRYQKHLLIGKLQGLKSSPLPKFGGAIWMPAAPASFYALWVLNKLFHRLHYQKKFANRKVAGP